MPAAVGRYLFAANILRKPTSNLGRRSLRAVVSNFWGFELARESAGIIRKRWLGAACALALICGTIPRAMASQDAGASKTSGQTEAKAASSGQTAVAQHKTSATSPHRKSKLASSRRSNKRRTARGQQKIDPERAQEIQEALVREHYLSATAVGTWNQASEDAMRRYQADHGWQSKTVPDARALISLGLGPKHDHLLNPESAMTSDPAQHSSSPPIPLPAATSSTPAKSQPESAPTSQSGLRDSSGPQ
jgi:hypothetical protein